MLITSFPSHGGGKITKEAIVTALGYEPPVNDTQGVNLIAGTSKPYKLEENVSNYNYAYFYLPEIILGETYTVSADIEVLKGNFNNISVIFHTRSLREDGYHTSTELRAEIKNGRIIGQITANKESTGLLLIYAGIMGSTSGNSIRISNLKLEPGIVTNPIWTPAPEDVVVRSELEGYFNQIAVNDLFAFVENNTNYFAFVKTNANTLNTPYTSGLTGGASAGSAVIFGGGSFATILYVPLGLPEIYMIKRGSGQWEDKWHKVSFDT